MKLLAFVVVAFLIGACICALAWPGSGVAVLAAGTAVMWFAIRPRGDA